MTANTILNVHTRQMDDVAFPWQLSLHTLRIIGFACAATEQTCATGALAAVTARALARRLRLSASTR